MIKRLSIEDLNGMLNQRSVRLKTWNTSPVVGRLRWDSSHVNQSCKILISTLIRCWYLDFCSGNHVPFDRMVNKTLFQIHHEKVEIKASSKIGSLANVKHRPGGGDKKIFDDKDYIRQMSDQISCTRSGPGSLNGSIVGSSMQVRPSDRLSS